MYQILTPNKEREGVSKVRHTLILLFSGKLRLKNQLLHLRNRLDKYEIARIPLPAISLFE